MRIVKILVMVCAAALAAPSFASVVYNFSLAAPTAKIKTATGSIEITDEAAASGQVFFRFCDTSMSCPVSVPNSPVLEFNFLVNQGDVVGGLRLIPTTGFSSYGTMQWNGVLDVSFDIVNSSISNLYLKASDGTQLVMFSGRDFSYVADGGACQSSQCFASGSFAVTAADIPEPATPALLLATLGAVALWRRRS